MRQSSIRPCLPRSHPPCELARAPRSCGGARFAHSAHRRVYPMSGLVIYWSGFPQVRMPQRQETEGHEHGEVTLKRSGRPDGRPERQHVNVERIAWCPAQSCRIPLCGLFGTSRKRRAGKPNSFPEWTWSRRLSGVRRGSILPNLLTRRSCRPTGSRGLGLPVLFSTVRFPAVNVGVDVPGLRTKMRLKCAAVGTASVNVNYLVPLLSSVKRQPKIPRLECRQLWEGNSVHRPCPSRGARRPRTASCLGRTVNGLD
jgi:hypothetical protein